MSDVNSNFVGSVPKYYDSALVPIIFIDYAQELVKQVIEREPKSVLELATGTGVVTRLLRDGVSRECEIFASDLNEPMLEVARQKFKADEAVSFQTIDAMEIPFEDHSVDVVVCQFGVMFFPDKVKSYREVLRILRPGGHYFFNAWDSHAFNPFAAVGQRVVEEAFPDDPPGFYKVPFHYHDAEEMKRDMNDAGFSSVEVERKQIKKKIPSQESFAKGFIYGNPIGEEIRMRGGDPDAMVEKVRDAMEAEFGKDPAEMPLSAFFVTGHK